MSKARFGTEEEAQCPEFAKIGTVTVDSSALPSPIPGSIYIGEPDARRTAIAIFLTANGFATHIKLAGVASPDPQTGQVVDLLRRTPPEPADRVQHALLRLRARNLRDADPVWNVCRSQYLRPLGRSASEPERDPVLLARLRAGRCLMPRCRAPLRPELRGGIAEQHRRASHSRSPCRSAGTTAIRTMNGVTISTPPGLWPASRASPTVRSRRSRRAPTRAIRASSRVGQSSCPAASQVGVSDAGAGAGSHPVLPAREGLPGRALQGRALSLAVVTPAVSGPYDLGNVVVRVALYVDPLTAQVTAVSATRSHRSSKASRCACGRC